MLSLVLSLSSCLTQKDINFREISNIRPHFSADSTRITFDLLLYNPNNWGMTVSKADVKFLLDGNVAGTSHLERPFKLKAEAESLVPCAIQCRNSDLYRILPKGIEVLLGSKTVSATASGTIKARKFVISKKYPFELNRKIDSKFIQDIF